MADMESLVIRDSKPIFISVYKVLLLVAYAFIKEGGAKSLKVFFVVYSFYAFFGGKN